MIGVISCIICVFAVFYKKRKTTFTYLTVSYALGNVGVIVIIGIYTASMVAINPVYAYDFWTTIWAGQILIFFEFASVLTFLVLSINRFSAVYFVIFYRTIFSKKKVTYYLTFVWGLSFLISCLNWIPDCHQYFEPLNFAFSIMETPCGNGLKHGAYYIPKLVIRVICIVADIASLAKLKMIESLFRLI